MALVLKGKCWKFGHFVPVDGGVMSREITGMREFNPDFLKQHIFEELDPEFPRKIKPGDIVVAGKRFGYGNPHVYGYIGIQAAGLGLLTESIPRGAFRNCIDAGVPLIPRCPDITELVDQGDELEVNFTTGRIKNLTKNQEHQFDPLPQFLLEIIEAGGTMGHLKKVIEQEKKEANQ